MTTIAFQILFPPISEWYRKDASRWSKIIFCLCSQRQFRFLMKKNSVFKKERKKKNSVFNI